MVVYSEIVARRVSVGILIRFRCVVGGLVGSLVRVEGDTEVDDIDDGAVDEDAIIVSGGGSSPAIGGKLFVSVENASKINKMV